MKSTRVSIFVCASVLGATASLKIVSAFGNTPILETPDVVFGLTYRSLFLLTGATEAVAAIGLTTIQNATVQSCILLLLGTNFLIYRLLQTWASPATPCPCMGTLFSGMPWIEPAVRPFLSLTAIYFITVALRSLCHTRPTKRPRLSPQYNALRFIAAVFPMLVLSNLADEQQNTITFKSFVESPPVLSTLIAEVCEKSIQTTAPDGKTTIIPKKCYYVLLRYQTNAFFYREAPALESLFSTNVFPTYKTCGYFDPEYWYITSDGSTIASTTNRSDRMVRIVNGAVTKASKILNFGIFDCPPGSIRWRINEFGPITNAFKLPMSGKLHQDGEEPPDRLDFHVKLDGHIIHWLASYTYHTTEAAPSALPAEIIAYAFPQGKKEWQFSVRIIELKISTSPLAREHFMPGPLAEQPWYAVQHSREEVVFKNKFEDKWRPLSSSHRSSLFLILAVNSVVVSVIWVLWWRRRGAQTLPSTSQK